MSNQPTSRQELYDRIRQSSQDAVILEEMVRLGFWPGAGVIPEDPADEIRRRDELEGQLRSLRTESSRLHNIEALRREARKRRMAESRRKRAETKERRLQQRQQRAAAWRERKKRDIVYLGPAVSGGLNETGSDQQKLSRQGLPPLHDAAQVAQAMGITVNELRFLAFDRRTSRVTHYTRFKIPKRSGGERLISAPMPRLKKIQRWILENVLDRLEPHPAAHGFRRHRSIVTNAEPHLQSDVVVNMDLADFFPTVTYKRVKGLFRSMGYSEAVATILGLLCTEPDTAPVELDGETYHVALGQRLLPQGAPTSPAVTNLICRQLDRRLDGHARKLQYSFTRYADDLTFSASGPAAQQVGRLLRRVCWTVDQEGFAVHPDKTRVLRKARRQAVTGITVNEKPGVERATLRRFRALLFQIEEDGPEGKHWGVGGAELMWSIHGYASFVNMVDPARGRALLERVRPLMQKYGKPTPPPRSRAQPAPATAPPAAPATESAPAAEPEATKKKKKWWKIF